MSNQIRLLFSGFNPTVVYNIESCNFFHFEIDENGLSDKSLDYDLFAPNYSESRSVYTLTPYNDLEVVELDWNFIFQNFDVKRWCKNFIANTFPGCKSLFHTFLFHSLNKTLTQEEYALVFFKEDGLWKQIKFNEREFKFYWAFNTPSKYFECCSCGEFAILDKLMKDISNSPNLLRWVQIKWTSLPITEQRQWKQSLDISCDRIE